MENTPLTVSDAIALINQTLDYAYPTLVVEGEVSSFKVNQNKYVFFDIKDESGTLGCFMMVYGLRVPLEDGMRIRVTAQPKLTQWGKFSLTVREVQPIGEGSLKRSFELLLAKLDKEGLFAAERKRTLPERPRTIGVISSVQAAGYADFIKILNERWGGVAVQVAQVAVQGAAAPQQIVRALEHFNQMPEPPDVIAIIRGGGSLDDLSAFNDEPLVRAIAGSRVPVITGIGHEVDTSLADMAADVRAATPSNAAQLLVPDRREIARMVQRDVVGMIERMSRRLIDVRRSVDERQFALLQRVARHHERLTSRLAQLQTVIAQLDPRLALARGYALLRTSDGVIITEAKVGDEVKVETKSHNMKAEVTYVESK
ncbi:MAG: exodeoxyribonuclease VII large subunit [Candidatus Saccharimonadales bacterium]